MTNKTTEPSFQPAYLALLNTGELASRVEQAYTHLEDCDLCARYCHVNRYQTIKGAVCRTGEKAVVNSFGTHHGEEDPLRDLGPMDPKVAVVCLGITNFRVDLVVFVKDHPLAAWL